MHYKYLTRKVHRYFGVIIGVQFLFWTLGGLYFSWSDMDEIHGSTFRKAKSFFSLKQDYAPIESIIQEIPTADSLKDIRLINILGKPHYQLSYFMNHDGHPMLHYYLADAQTGKTRAPLSEKEAVELAKEAFNKKVKVSEVHYLTKDMINDHHEYRNGIFPVYQVQVKHPSNTNIYVASEAGMVTSFRNAKWRVFDFLWMLHTMDYQERDEIGNLLLRIFSVLGIVTILSGFVLWYISSPTVRRFTQK